MSDETVIRIGLPLPLDVSAALITAIGTMWPTATIRTDARDMQLVIPRRKPKRLTKRTMAAILAEMADDDAPETDMDQITQDGGVRVALNSADESWQQLAAWAYTVLTATEAANYAEQHISAKTPDGERKQLVVIAAWSPEQTPHQLRKAAWDEGCRFAGREPKPGDNPYMSPLRRDDKC